MSGYQIVSRSKIVKPYSYAFELQLLSAIEVLEYHKARWETKFWAKHVDKPIWVWLYGIPVKASSSDIKETITLHEKRVWGSLATESTLLSYKKGSNWLSNDIRTLKAVLRHIALAGNGGEIHLSTSDCYRLDEALDVDKTKACLEKLINDSN